MATATVLINGQAIGTSTNVGNNLFSINQVTLQPTTTAFYLDAKIANGATAGAVDHNQKIVIHYSITNYTVTAAEAPNTLNHTSHSLSLRPRNGASAERIMQSDLEVAAGAQKISCWVDAPTFPVAGALTVTLVELP